MTQRWCLLTVKKKFKNWASSTHVSIRLGSFSFSTRNRKKKWGRNAPAREGPRGYIGLAEVGLFHADAPPLETLLVVVFSVWTLEAPGVDGRAEPSLL